MREFFRGWRRKIGAVTLVMACGIMGMWVRSVQNHDYVRFAVRANVTERVVSLGGTINWLRYHQEPVIIREWFEWESPEWGTSGFDGIESFDSDLQNWNWRWRCFGFVSGEWPESFDSLKTGILIVPYWSIALPLTAISAFLLLAMPRPSTQMKINDGLPKRGIESSGSGEDS